jgi:hypothetical protein
MQSVLKIPLGNHSPKYPGGYVASSSNNRRLSTLFAHFHANAAREIASWSAPSAEVNFTCDKNQITFAGSGIVEQPDSKPGPKKSRIQKRIAVAASVACMDFENTRKFLLGSVLDGSRRSRRGKQKKNGCRKLL